MTYCKDICLLIKTLPWLAYIFLFLFRCFAFSLKYTYISFIYNMYTIPSPWIKESKQQKDRSKKNIKTGASYACKTYVTISWSKLFHVCIFSGTVFGPQFFSRNKGTGMLIANGCVCDIYNFHVKWTKLPWLVTVYTGRKSPTGKKRTKHPHLVSYRMWHESLLKPITQESVLRSFYFISIFFFML